MTDSLGDIKYQEIKLITSVSDLHEENYKNLPLVIKKALILDEKTKYKKGRHDPLQTQNANRNVKLNFYPVMSFGIRKKSLTFFST